VLELGTGRISEKTPKNLFTLGGRFRTDSGLVGSLYLFSRSEFTEGDVENPEGLLAPAHTVYMDNAMLFMGKLGYRWETGKGLDFEIGAKLFTPVSPFSGPLFRYHEKGGVRHPSGQVFGGDELRRMVVGYFQGSF